MCMEYKIATSKHIVEFQAVVNAYVKENWTPQGGLVVDGEWYMQAMTRKEKKKTGAKKFKKPTSQELNLFARENNLTLKGFYDYYESKGWKVGNSPMKDWQAAARGWNKRGFGADVNVPNKGAATKTFDFTGMDEAAKNKSTPEKIKELKKQMYKSTGMLPEHKESDNE